MPRTLVCSARKSPPRSVSLTWMSGWSPSPLVFTAPLMPPCAQTECERLTGTMERRSTLWPASQSLMTVIRPASPPPTTVNLCSAMGVLPRSGDGAEAHPEEDAQRAHREGDEEQPGEQGHAPLGQPPHGDAPGPAESLQAVGEVPDGAERSEDVERENVVTGQQALHSERGRIAKVCGDVPVGDQAVCRRRTDRGQVVPEQRDPGPERPHVDQEEDERDDAGHALGDVAPVARVRVPADVGPA